MRQIFAKRLIDIFVSGTALLILPPILGLIVLLIRLRMGSPILFRQIRPGLHAKPFTFYKFRTMTCDCNENGCPLPDECRLTRLGQFLRRTSLDELPQLWNVLKGDMSLVGPRPLLTEYMPLYTNEQFRRFEVKPGMVGWAGVNGRNCNTWEKKFELDVWYIDNWSLWLDIKILLKTVLIVISGSGVNEEGCATASRFTGSPQDR
jgi:sugar transferase EpsL